MKQAIVLILLFFGFVSQAPPFKSVSAVQSKPKPNVLFIAVDDLNHWVKHLGDRKSVV